MDSTDKRKGYNGNPCLKPAGVEIEWTQEMLSEYIKCSQDPLYFANKYVKFVTLDHGFVNIELRGYQEEMITSMAENRNTVVCTARQAGKSTSVVCFMLWYVLFQKDKVVALLANKEDTAVEILSRVQLAYLSLPWWLQQGVTKWNNSELILENNSCIFASATSSSGIRGYAINCLFIDEAAHIENWDEFFTSVYPTVSSGKSSKVILVSTPNGLNHFHQVFDNAKKKKNEYKWVEVPWQKVPGRDDAWYQKTLSDLNYDTDKFAQEYECQFLGSSGTLIAGWKLKELLDTRQNPIKASEGLSQYEAPIKGNRYFMVCDVSRGKGLDYSAFSVIDCTKTPYRQVCVYRSNKTTPADYADTIFSVATMYNKAYVLCEVNDIGGEVASRLHSDLEYENVLWSEAGGPKGKRLSSGFGTASGREAGVKTTLPLRTLGCSMIKVIVEGNKLEVYDVETISELSTFSKKKNKYEAEPGKHDDIVMGLVLFGWMTAQQYFKDLTEIDTLKEVRDKTDDRVMEELTPFGFVVGGYDEPPALTPAEARAGWTSVNDWLLDDDYR